MRIDWLALIGALVVIFYAIVDASDHAAERRNREKERKGK